MSNFNQFHLPSTMLLQLGTLLCLPSPTCAIDAGDRAKIGVIIGAVLGGIGFFALLGVLFWMFCVRKRMVQKAKEEPIPCCNASPKVYRSKVPPPPSQRTVMNPPSRPQNPPGNVAYRQQQSAHGYTNGDVNRDGGNRSSYATTTPSLQQQQSFRSNGGFSEDLGSSV